MQALQIEQANGPLLLRVLPVPQPGPGQVLVKMEAAPINPSDLAVIAGTYGDTRPYPFTPGIEGSGTVVKTGSGLLARWLRGRRVACSAMSQGQGTYAEYMVTSAHHCVPLKSNISFHQGAMLLVNPLTALAIFSMAKEGKHRAIVNTAAGSALGGMLLRLGRRMKIPVLHIVHKSEQAERIRSQGESFVLSSADSDFEVQLEAAAHQLNATLWLDAVGGTLTQTLLAATPRDSTLLMYACLSQQSALIDPVLLISKNIQLQGWHLSQWLAAKNIVQLA